MTALAQGQQSSAIYLLRNSEPYDAVFNDPSLSANVGGLAGEDGITGLDSPEIREAAADLVEADGGLHGNFWFGRRPITINTLVSTPSIAVRESLLERVRRATALMRSNGTLYWFPGDPAIVTTTRENLVANPSFEYDTVAAAPFGWTDITDAAYTSRTFAVAAANPISGVNSLRIKGTKDATATSRVLGVTSAALPVVGGLNYSMQVRATIADDTVAGQHALTITWLDANGATISAITTNVGTTTMNGIAVAPSNATSATITRSVTSVTASDVIDIYLDSIQFVQESSIGAYLDGDSANSSWLGIRGQSTSVNRPNARCVTTLRRQQPLRFAGIGWTKSVLIALIAADPRIYSAAIYDRSVAPATDLTLENQGDAESPPQRLRVTGPGVNPTVKLTANGVARSIKFTGLTLAGGEYFDIDVLNRTIITPSGKAAATAVAAGGSLYGYLDFTNTNWWGLMPGPSNVARVDWVSGSTAASTLQVRYRDAWL